MLHTHTPIAVCCRSPVHCQRLRRSGPSLSLRPRLRRTASLVTCCPSNRFSCIHRVPNVFSLGLDHGFYRLVIHSSKHAHNGRWKQPRKFCIEQKDTRILFTIPHSDYLCTFSMSNCDICRPSAQYATAKIAYAPPNKFRNIDQHMRACTRTAATFFSPLAVHAHLLCTCGLCACATSGWL